MGRNRGLIRVLWLVRSLARRGTRIEPEEEDVRGREVEPECGDRPVEQVIAWLKGFYTAIVRGSVLQRTRSQERGNVR
jgi:hypothetical protein